MNVSLPPELERLVEKRARSGKYSDPSQVIREGLEFFFAHERDLKSRRFFVHSTEDLEEKLVAGVRRLNAGQGIPIETARKDLETKAKLRRAK